MVYETNLIINNRELKYSGIFRAEELFSAVNRALEERGYTKQEKKMEELVTEDGKKSYIELRPIKIKTNYTFFMLKIKIYLDSVTEVIETVSEEKKKFHKGDITMVFDAWLYTDYEARWGERPLVYFLRAIINKFLYKFPLEGSFPGELTKDTAHVYVAVKKLLNAYKGEVGRRVREEDVVQQMMTEIGKELE